MHLVACRGGRSIVSTVRVGHALAWASTAEVSPPPRCRLQPLILAAFAHTHKRVKAAALHLVQACLRLDGATFEGAAAEVLPPVLELTATQPAAVATGAQAAVAAMAARLPADALAHALLAATEVRAASCPAARWSRGA